VWYVGARYTVAAESGPASGKLIVELGRFFGYEALPGQRPSAKSHSRGQVDFFAWVMLAPYTDLS
jgi:hypothetical protein